MEFKTRISEKDHLAAAQLWLKSPVLSVLTVIGYFVFFASGMVILGSFVLVKLNPGDSVAHGNLIVASFNLFPFGSIAVLWTLYYRLYIPMYMRNKYRKNLNNIGEWTEVIDANGVSELSSAGSSIRHPWTVCSYWRESKAVFILVLQSRIYFTYPKACLSTGRQEELRAILAAHLPKK